MPPRARWQRAEVARYDRPVLRGRARRTAAAAPWLLLAGCLTGNPKFDDPSGGGGTSGTASSTDAGDGGAPTTGASDGGDTGTGGAGGGTSTDEGTSDAGDSTGTSMGGGGSTGGATSSPGATATSAPTTSADPGTSTDAGTSTGPATTSTSDVTGPATTSAREVVLAADADAYLRQQFPDENHGAAEFLRIGSGSQQGRANRAVFWFDVSSLAPGCNVTGAQLRLYYYGDGDPAWSGVDPDLSLCRITASWTEGGATWRARNVTQNWASAGGDFDAVPIDEVTVTGGQYGWVEWELGWLVEDWCDGTEANQGVVVVEIPDNNGNRGRKLFRASEHPTGQQRPQLVVQVGG